MKATELRSIIREEIRRVLNENQKPSGNVTEEEFLYWLDSINTKAVKEIQTIDTSESDSIDLVNTYNSILKKYHIPVVVKNIKLDNYGGIKSMFIR